MAESKVGPWAREKLERLRKYLHEYTKIMRAQKWCAGYFYIDAFAGPGTHLVRHEDSQRLPTTQIFTDAAAFIRQEPEQIEFLAGSPQVALDLQHPFSHYVFIEKDAARVRELEKLKVKYGKDRKITIRQADCNQYLLTKVASNPKIDWKRHRAVVFLDPFGMQVTWATLKTIASTKAIEVFLNFPVGMAIQRLLLRNPEKFTESRRRKLDSFFGSADWFDVLYKKERGLFNEDTAEKVEDSGSRLLRWYRGRLKQIFGYVSEAGLICNSRGGHLYYLLVASPNAAGAKIASYILKNN